MECLHNKVSYRTRLFATRYIWFLWLVKAVIQPLESLSRLPSEEFSPVGLPRQLPESVQLLLVDRNFLIGFQVLTIVVLVLCFTPCVKPIASFTLACILVTIHQGIVRGFGFINHAEISLVYAAYVMAGAEWADALSGPSDESSARSTRNGFPLTLTLGIFCLTYSLAGVNRIIRSRFGTRTEYFDLATWLIQTSREPLVFNFPLGSIAGEWPFLDQCLRYGFLILTVLEVACPLCLFSKFWRRLFVSIMLPSHILILLTLGVLFWENIALFVFFFDLDKLFNRDQR